MIKNISLIEPAAADWHTFSVFRLPRLGLPLIGTILKKNGFNVKIYCEDVKKITPGDTWEIYNSDMVGISITTSTAPAGYRIAKILRRRGLPVVIGGVHATFMPEEALKHADYCVRGEGEETIVELVNALNDSGELSGIKGLSYKKNGEIYNNEDRRPIENLDKLPIPDLSLIKGYERIKIAPIATSRGCPFDCDFCSVTPMFGRRYRFRSTESVLAEIRKNRDKHIFFYDDNFTANPKRTKEILSSMLDEGLTCGWSAQVRVDVVKDEELMDLCVKTNCFTFYVGLESVNPKTLEAFHKRQNLEEIKECIEESHRRGIAIHGMFIFGSDEDDLETINSTVDFVRRSGIESLQFLILVPLPGSRTYQTLEKEGRIFTREWQLYDGNNIVFEPKMITPYDLQRTTFKALGRFYSLWELFKQIWTFDATKIFKCFVGRRIVKKWTGKNKKRVAQLKKEQIHWVG